MERPNSQIIKCNVKTCKHNDKVKYCTLNNILIGEHVSNAKSTHETDCMSFEPEIQ
ncbi:DUF1540 domain-containing protein [Defluviitalea phaphyphila]|uniref:DUF1540 domain-containing protein n=1 Tax=Defluviitalea phaphyphila TaxID=1473580 RepID=UPI001FA6FC03|nr:DUF1540 domain-containing protein [Defluviitalea phaphyphila]